MLGYSGECVPDVIYAERPDALARDRHDLIRRGEARGPSAKSSFAAALRKETSKLTRFRRKNLERCPQHARDVLATPHERY